MGLLSIVMAALTVAGAIAGVALAVMHRWQPLIDGAVLAAALVAATWLATAAGHRFDQVAGALRTSRIGAARLAAVVGNGIPVATIFVGCALAFVLIARSSGPAPALLPWSYAVATAPAVLIAGLSTRRAHTLLGLRAFGAQIGYVLIVVMAHVLHASPAVWAPILAAWAVVPAAMGCVMALARPDVLRSVRV